MCYIYREIVDVDFKLSGIGYNSYYYLVFSWYFKKREEERSIFFFLYSMSIAAHLSDTDFPRSFAIFFPSLPSWQRLALLKHGILDTVRLSREENGIEIKSLFRYRAIRFDGCKEEFFSW